MLPLQQSMAVALQLAGPLGVYLEQLVWRMRPPIEAQVLEDSFNAVAARHAALRAAFAVTDEPHLVVHSKISVKVEEISRPTDEAARDQALNEFLEKDRRNSPDLAAAPVWRLSLLRFAPDDAALVWTFPHAMLDGRSIARILEEVAREVTSATPGRSQVNGDDSVSFAQYQSRRAEQDFQASIDWWAKKLEGTPGPVEFPKDPDAPGNGQFVAEFALNESAMTPVLAMAERLGVTANTLCQAAWALVLGSQSGMRDVVFLTVRACRQGRDGRDSALCGMLMNSVPVRARLDRETTAAAFLTGLRRLQVEARDHELAPLEEVQQAAGFSSGAGLFTSGLMVDYEDVWCRAAALLGTGHDFFLEERPTPTPLLCVTVRRSLKARLIARGAQMSEATADRMVQQFGFVLQELARNPDRRLEEFDLITPEERFRTVAAYNATVAPFPANSCLHHAFEARAETSAARTAVIGPDGVLTYAGLEKRANRIANRLIGLGARPGGLVIIRLEKSTDLVAAILGVLKTGCGYVPVDPDWPEERFRFIVRSTAPAAIVSMSGHCPPVFEGTHALLLDRDRDSLAEAAAARPQIAADPSSIAYIIFTSGSTGVPKGVAIDHRGAVNTITDCNYRYAVQASDRIFGISACTFDLSVYDVFGTLAAGAAVVLCPGKAARDPETWCRLVREYKITIWNSVPQIVEMLVEAAQNRPELLASLRLIMMSGDWIPVGLPDRIRAVAPKAEIWSLGGATEASIWSIARPIHRVDPSWPSIPYGRPMANQSFYVLDDELRPCPTLVPGDLYIGGIGLAKGYWADPARTAEAFITHPKWKTRLYRTGDRGRFLPTGEIEFLGRRDLQVKIGGFRIELGEIEQALAAHSSVRDCAVTKHDSAKGAAILVAYVVPKNGQSFDAEALRVHLGARLPSYMVPPVIVPVDALPLSANGKVNRKALPAPAMPAAGAVTNWTADEELMAALWEEVLGVRPDSPDRDFFECGGTSLLSFRLAELIKRRTGRQIGAERFFEVRPTVRTMAAELSAGTAAAPAPAAAPILGGMATGHPRWLVQVSSGSRPPFFFIGQYLDLGRFLSPDQPFYGVLLGFEVRLELANVSFTEIAAAVLREIRRVQPRGPYYLGGYCFGAVLAFEIALQLRQEGEEIAYFSMFEAAAPRSIGQQQRPRFEKWRYRLRRLLQTFTTNPFSVTAKSIERLLDDVRLRFLGLSGDRPFADFAPQRYDGPIDLFLCQESPQRLFPERDARLGWAKWCTSLNVEEVPGNHITMLREPQVRTLAPKVDERLRRAQAAAARR
ncbi:MAG TPA: amino acid adenylation domain-containing protein [Opitutaceae bacterium]|nr:amino acid adenylation domain-containing protein [Opitutaceae bacterium]